MHLLRRLYYETSYSKHNKKTDEQFSDDRFKDPEPGVPGHVLELWQGVENDNHETCPTFRMELYLTGYAGSRDYVENLQYPWRTPH